MVWKVGLASVGEVFGCEVVENCLKCLNIGLEIGSGSGLESGFWQVLVLCSVLQVDVTC